ncbi:MAG: DUF983 domain-containing protein [Muricauda sp.]|nr:MULTISPECIES: DUF983 domain-containing protein [unclassified Allomuricauda]MAU17519.1 DUF983 domain-containing protein [Allomuricauda sp.]|tara:strand:- start:19152 stop:19553 length:402 start_codon:yes stop_codon:yes gene_type:complete
MLKKGTKMYSILTGNCPRCHEESMYENPNPYVLSKIFSMNERCSHCGLKYKIEPSFFYGAMYVSYAVGVAFAVAAFVISFLFIGTSLLTTFISIVATLIVFMPLIIRLSRNIWINFFVKYDPDAVKKYKAAKS